MAFTEINGEWNWRDSRGQSVPLVHVVKDLNTPFYLYDLEDIDQRIRSLQQGARSLHLHYAMKANSNRAILDLMRERGVGLDVVSLGELERAILLGFSPAQIVFSGVGKTVHELDRAIELEIAQINVESAAELKRLVLLCKRQKKSAAVAIRLNPDVEASTHPYIQTGFRENKFGVDEAMLPELLEIIAANSKYVQLKGLTLHIGSQIRDLNSFEQAFKKAKKVFVELNQRFAVTTFDIGGGLGIDYNEDGANDFDIIANYLKVVSDTFSDLPDVKLLAEPGRILVARGGILVTQVEYLKETPFKKFAIVNSGMHHLLRPALYQAFHRIEKLKSRGGDKAIYDIVGPICESSDVLGKGRLLEKIDEGDTLLIFDVGAYGAAMASNYNLHDLPREYVIDNGRIKEVHS